MEGFEHYNLLMIDDHNLSSKLLLKQLEVFGIKNIDLCSNGHEGIERLNNKHYDIVIVDWAMPVMDGLEFVKRSTESQDLSRTALIMLSAEAEPEKILEAMEAGVTYYLTKPADQQKINDALNAVHKWIQDNN